MISRLQALSVVAAILGVAAAVPPHWSELSGNYGFEQYCADFGKRYGLPEEYALRQGVFEAELREIRRHNADGSASYKKGVNAFSDQTREERAKVNGYNKMAERVAGDRQAPIHASKPILRATALPKLVDWRSCGSFADTDLCPLGAAGAGRPVPVVTAVKNQGACGSCWAFASVSVLESHYAIANPGRLQDLSPQQLVSCAPNTDECGGTGGCAGSTGDLAYEYIHKAGGLAGEYTYGYTSNYGQDGMCDLSRATAGLKSSISGYVKPESNNYEALMTAVATEGPVVVNVDASKWHSYSEGIFSGCSFDENIDINHAVTLVGYGEDEAGAYWLIRNSWGPEWGEEGYIKLAREASTTCGADTTPMDGVACAKGPEPVANSTEVCGQCGVAFQPVFPRVDSATRIEA